MCGRFTLTVTDQEFIKYIGDQFEIQINKNQISLPRYNIAPGTEVLSMISDGENYRVGKLLWGFVPPYSKEGKPSFSMINAKAETLSDKPSYKQSYEKKRCVIFADSFYEWNKTSEGKQPVRILKKDKSIFPIAGLYTTYTSKDGMKIHSTVIITTKANTLVSQVHDRMPVILNKDTLITWLNPKIMNISILSELLQPYDSKEMEMYPVSNIVNSSSNDIIDCILEKKE